MTQTEMNLFPARCTKQDDADLLRFIEFLRRHAVNGQHITARRIMDHTGWTDRKVRDVAKHSRGRIISGNKGYKLNRMATHEEIEECTGRLISQAREMHERATTIWRVWHQGDRE